MRREEQKNSADVKNVKGETFKNKTRNYLLFLQR
jgi:hypothetical protein